MLSLKSNDITYLRNTELCINISKYMEIINEIINKIILDKIKKSLDSLELDYGTVIEIPSYNLEDLSKIEYLGSEALSYFVSKYHSHVGDVFYQYFYDEVYPKYEKKNKFFLYEILYSYKNSIKFVLDLDEDLLKENSIFVSDGYPMIAKLKNGECKYYIMKDNYIKSEDVLHWIEVDEEIAKSVSNKTI